MESGKNESTKLMAVIADFCTFFGHPEIKEDLWYCIVTALSKSGSLYDEADERSQILFIYGKLAHLLEAMYSWNAVNRINETLKLSTDGEHTGQ